MVAGYRPHTLENHFVLIHSLNRPAESRTVTGIITSVVLTEMTSPALISGSFAGCSGFFFSVGIGGGAPSVSPDVGGAFGFD
jgi:hypothetical protein